MPHSQGLSNNSYPEPNQPNSPSLIPISSMSILILSSHLRLGLPKGLFPVGLPVNIYGLSWISCLVWIVIQVRTPFLYISLIYGQNGGT